MSQSIPAPPADGLNTRYVGKPTSRVDDPVKVSGEACYAADYPVPDLWYGYLVNSPIAKGRITKFEAGPVLALPGVKRVFTHENVPSLAWFDWSYQDDTRQRERLSGRCTRPTCCSTCSP